MSKRAAHFIHWATSFSSPPNEGLITALLETGYNVDVYCPESYEGVVDTTRYGDRVKALRYQYGKRWFASNVLSPRWRGYTLFLCTTEDPAIVAGPLSALWRRPLVVLADEIKSGSTAGDRGERWKRICRWAMRRAQFTIVNDESRIPVQRDYAGLQNGRSILAYPAFYREAPAPADRSKLRADWGIPDQAFVIVFSGVFYSERGADWIVRAMDWLPDDVHLLVQPGNIDSLTAALLEEHRCADRIHRVPRRLTFHESWASMAACDAGVVFYLHDAPQFRNMGLSSNRMCMYLQMGLPVIATRQPSFDFLENSSCGVLIDSAEEIPDAVGTIRARHGQMSRNAAQIKDDYAQLEKRYQTVLNQIRKIRE